MLRLVGQVVGQAVQHLQASITDLHSRIANVEHAQSSLDAPWGDDGMGPEPYDIPSYGAADEAYARPDRDEVMSDLDIPHQEELDRANEPHPFFYHVYKVLAKHGAAVNVQDDQKSTPFHLASMGGHIHHEGDFVILCSYF